MLNEDMIELYQLFCEEKKIKEEISVLRSELTDVKDNIEAVKQRVLEELLHMQHKYAKYKDMTALVKTKQPKVKIDKDQLESVIESIIEADMDTKTKREKILTAMKPVETGEILDVLVLKKEK